MVAHLMLVRSLQSLIYTYVNHTQPKLTQKSLNDLLCTTCYRWAVPARSSNAKIEGFAIVLRLQREGKASHGLGGVQIDSVPCWRMRTTTV